MVLYIDYRQTDFPPLMGGESCLSSFAQQTPNARELKYIPLLPIEWEISVSSRLEEIVMTIIACQDSLTSTAQ